MDAPAPARAVFLSYAREDAEAARRIADALRAFGVEVWFDQNELRGGDSWDQKIRKQIRDCALFMPVISATTQDRGEGYFRREWKLGVERTHDMAAGVPFIVPVTIDDVPAREASVPEEFLRYQWTHLPRGIPRPEFVVQVQGLLNAPRKAASATTPAPAASRPERAAAAASAAPRKGSGTSTALVVAVAVVVLAISVFVGMRFLSQPAQPVTAAPAPSTVATTSADDHSVAVLPFENLSADKDNDAFFADGIHEDILTKLSLVRALRVVSRTSVMQYRATTKAIPQIARELGVSYILEGSVRRAGTKVRITGQLIRAASDEHIWAQAYDRDITDIFAIQGEVAQAIADALQTQLSPEEKSLIENRPTTNAEAYDLYLRARAISDSTEPTAHAEALLKAALQLDPKFAQAWSALARTEAFAFFNEDDATSGRLALAKQAIERALALAPDDPAVIENEGDYYYYAYRDYDRARAQYLRLSSLKPNQGELKRALALIDRRQGRVHAAIDGLTVALRLDPADQSAAVALAETLLFTNRFPDAENLINDISRRFPTNGYLTGLRTAVPYYRDGSTAAMLALDRMPVTGGDAELYSRKVNASIRGDWPVVVRMYRDHPILDVAGGTHWSQLTENAIGLDDAGEHAEARQLAAAAMAEIDGEIARQTQSTSIWAYRGALSALLGDSASALADTDKACRMLPVSKDALQAPTLLMIRASVLARVGQTDRAIEEVARAVRRPFGPNVHWLLQGDFPPVSFRMLAGNPRFEALVRDPANNAPVE